MLVELPTVEEKVDTSEVLTPLSYVVLPASFEVVWDTDVVVSFE